MYYNNYEDYMRNTLGYNNMMNNNFNTYPMYYEYDNNQNMDIEGMYPEIYHQVNPIVENCCSKYRNTKFSKEVLEQMTEQVYNQYSETRGVESTKVENQNKTNNVRKEEETRSPNNNSLRDLIRILILKNLFPSRPGRPNRLPMGPGMPPPGWQGGPNRPGGMPPYQPRYY